MANYKVLQLAFDKLQIMRVRLLAQMLHHVMIACAVKQGNG